MRTDVLFRQEFYKANSKRGKPTRIVARLWKALEEMGYLINKYGHHMVDDDTEYYKLYDDLIVPQYSTIRKGNNFKEGAMVTFRIWTRKPRESYQFFISPDDIKLHATIPIKLENKTVTLNGQALLPFWMADLAKMEGYSTVEEFWDWYMTPIKGQLLIFHPEKAEQYKRMFG